MKDGYKKSYRRYKKKNFYKSVKNVIHSELDKKYVEANYIGTLSLSKFSYTFGANTFNYPLCVNPWNLICGMS